MSNLQELLQEMFTESSDLTEKLAVFQSKPAIFHQTSPEDEHPDWESASQYPRMDYRLDWKVNAEKRSIGTLKVRLWCEADQILPEDIEPAMKRCLHNVFIQPQGNLAYGFQCKKAKKIVSDSNSDESRKKIVGRKVIFYIMEYGSQETTDPDPIVALIQYSKKLIPNAVYLGMDNIDKSLQVDTSVPAFYYRLINITRSNETNTSVWINGKIEVHVFGASHEMRTKWIMYLLNQLSLSGEIVMTDQSPMFIKEIKVNHYADHLVEGQMCIDVQYGLMKYEKLQHKLQKAFFNMSN